MKRPKKIELDREKALIALIKDSPQKRDPASLAMSYNIPVNRVAEILKAYGRI